MSNINMHLGPEEARRRETVVSAIAETLDSTSRISHCVNLRVHVDEKIAARILALVWQERRRHVPWAKIGAELGISGQAANRKYGEIR